MKRGLATLFLLGVLVPTGLPARAADPAPAAQPTVEAQKQALAARSREVERRIRALTARTHRRPAGARVVRRNRLRRQQAEIQSLIRRLECGESVAPGEVERLLHAN